MSIEKTKILTGVVFLNHDGGKKAHGTWVPQPMNACNTIDLRYRGFSVTYYKVISIIEIRVFIAYIL